VGAWSAAVTAEHPVRPLDEVLHVRAVFVAAVVLSPGQFALEQARVDRRHQRRPVVLLLPDVPHAKPPTRPQPTGKSATCRAVVPHWSVAAAPGFACSALAGRRQIRQTWKSALRTPRGHLLRVQSSSQFQPQPVLQLGRRQPHCLADGLWNFQGDAHGRTRALSRLEPSVGARTRPSQPPVHPGCAHGFRAQRGSCWVRQ